MKFNLEKLYHYHELHFVHRNWMTPKRAEVPIVHLEQSSVEDMNDLFGRNCDWMRLSWDEMMNSD